MNLPVQGYFILLTGNNVQFLLQKNANKLYKYASMSEITSYLKSKYLINLIHDERHFWTIILYMDL